MPYSTSQITLSSYLTWAIIISIVLFFVSAMPVLLSVFLGFVAFFCIFMAKTKHPKTALCFFFGCFVLAFMLVLPSLFVRKCGPRIASKIAGLEAALKQYEVDFGEYPPHIPKTFESNTLVIYLDGDTSNGGPEIAYFEFKPDEVDSSGRFIDFYKRSFHYRQPHNPDGSVELSTILKNKFDLWSEGETSVEEGDTSGSDDVANWKD